MGGVRDGRARETLPSAKSILASHGFLTLLKADRCVHTMVPRWYRKVADCCKAFLICGAAQGGFHSIVLPKTDPE